jgi:MarR family 2-MHQ and catechol resistance regulon transcriptional repressor
VSTPLDDPRITAMGMLVEAHAALAHALGRDIEAACDLPLTWFEVLLRLGRSQERRLRMSELAAQVSFSASGVTRLVDRIEAAGLIRRESCPSDRRGSFAVLTEPGEAKLAPAVAVHLRGLDGHLVARLRPGELDALTDMLRRVRDGLASPSGPAGGAEPPAPAEAGGAEPGATPSGGR